MTVKSNSGIIGGKQKIVSKANASGIHSIRDQNLHRVFDEWPLKPAITSVSPSGTYIWMEGQPVSYTVNTSEVVDGTVLYWNLDTTGQSYPVSAADFTGNSLTGTVTIFNNTGTITVGDGVFDNLTEGDANNREGWKLQVGFTQGGPYEFTHPSTNYLEDSSLVSRTVTFNRHMYGGAFNYSPAYWVYNLDSTGAVLGQIYSENASNSNSWQSRGPYSFSSSTPCYVCFVAQRGSYWQCDFALDNIRITTSSGTTNTYSFEGGNDGFTTRTSGTSHSYTDIQNNFNNRTNLGYTYVSWTRDAYGTPSSSTGPNGGALGTWYIFTENSGGSTGNRHFLYSPAIY